ncbi:MAG: hypothetical protein AB1646_24420 [Thermodesulfobacteriota bacterium]
MHEPTLTWRELAGRWQLGNERLCNMLVAWDIPVFASDSNTPVPAADLPACCKDGLRIRLSDLINTVNRAQAWRDFVTRMGANPDRDFFSWAELAERWEKSDFLLARTLAKYRVPVWIETERGPVPIDPSLHQDKRALRVSMRRILELEYRSWERHIRDRPTYLMDAQGYGDSSDWRPPPETPPRAPFSCEDTAADRDAEPATADQSTDDRSLEQVQAELRKCAEAARKANPRLTIPAFMKTPEALTIVKGFECSLGNYQKWLVGLFGRAGRPRKEAV